MTMKARRERSIREYFAELARQLGADYYTAHGQGD